MHGYYQQQAQNMDEIDVSILRLRDGKIPLRMFHSLLIVIFKRTFCANLKLIFCSFDEKISPPEAKNSSEKIPQKPEDKNHNEPPLPNMEEDTEPESDLGKKDKQTIDIQ